MQGSRVLPKLFTFFGVPLTYLDGRLACRLIFPPEYICSLLGFAVQFHSFQDCRPSCIKLTNMCERPICSLLLDSSCTAQWIREKKDEDKGKSVNSPEEILLHPLAQNVIKRGT